MELERAVERFKRLWFAVTLKRNVDHPLARGGTTRHRSTASPPRARARTDKLFQSLLRWRAL